MQKYTYKKTTTKQPKNSKVHVLTLLDLNCLQRRRTHYNLTKLYSMVFNLKGSPENTTKKPEKNNASRACDNF